MKIKKVQSVCLILACVAATGLIGCGKTDETSKKHEAITFMAPYLDVDSFIEEVHKTYPEVNLEVITYSGSNTTTYLQNMLEA
ncbi:MAG: ABC transporter substrate-binding protein, partial [Blautia sp.]|nr:ABC transporter substrate-binding protein [Blautia sp.]